MVTALLHRAPGKIHLSFNLWISYNHLSLLSKLNFKTYTALIANLYIGIDVHFMDTGN